MQLTEQEAKDVLSVFEDVLDTFDEAIKERMLEGHNMTFNQERQDRLRTLETKLKEASDGS
jgi:hypothetical protein